MTFPKDITALVTQIAETPGVQRVWISKFGDDRLSPVVAWPKGFKATEPIMLEDQHILFAEGEWTFPANEIDDVMPALNRLRSAAGLSPIKNVRANTYTTSGKYFLRNPSGVVFSGDIQFGFLD